MGIMCVCNWRGSVRVPVDHCAAFHRDEAGCEPIVEIDRTREIDQIQKREVDDYPRAASNVFPDRSVPSVAETDARAAFTITAIPRPRAGEVHLAFEAFGSHYTATIPVDVARQIGEAIDGALSILDGQHPAQRSDAVEGLGK
jgi:hypothetical protein